MNYLVIAVRDNEVDTETVYFGFLTAAEAYRFARTCARAVVKPLTCP